VKMANWKMPRVAGNHCVCSLICSAILWTMGNLGVLVIFFRIRRLVRFPIFGSFFSWKFLVVRCLKFIQTFVSVFCGFCLGVQVNIFPFAVVADWCLCNCATCQ